MVGFEQQRCGAPNDGNLQIPGKAASSADVVWMWLLQDCGLVGKCKTGIGECVYYTHYLGIFPDQ